MQRMDGQIRSLKAEAARCERLCAGSYDPALSTQLLTLAREYRHRASLLEARRLAA